MQRKLSLSIRISVNVIEDVYSDFSTTDGHCCYQCFLFQLNREIGQCNALRFSGYMRGN